MENTKIFAMPFGRVYPLYIAKAERKGRTKAEVDEIIGWLTGYDETALQELIAQETSFEIFFREAPRINPNAALIKGVICGHRVEDIEDETLQNIRYLDKLIDELAKGKSMGKILRK